MTAYALGAHARSQLSGIYRYSRKRWGDAQADRYVGRLFATFAGIAEGRVRSRPIPQDLEIDGHFCTCGQHFIYWRRQRSGRIEIVAIVDQRRAQAAQVRAVFDPER